MEIQDVKCTPLHFDKNTRLLVEMQKPMDPIKINRMYHTIKNWAGPDVEILIIDPSLVRIKVEDAISKRN